jgi:hypothetical protein
MSNLQRQIHCTDQQGKMNSYRSLKDSSSPLDMCNRLKNQWGNNSLQDSRRFHTKFPGNSSLLGMYCKTFVLKTLGTGRLGRKCS